MHVACASNIAVFVTYIGYRYFNVSFIFDRYLVFFDDGYAQYNSRRELHKVCEQSRSLLIQAFIVSRVGRF